MAEASLPKYVSLDFLMRYRYRKNKSIRLFLDYCLACMYSYSFIE